MKIQKREDKSKKKVSGESHMSPIDPYPINDEVHVDCGPRVHVEESSEPAGLKQDDPIQMYREDNVQLVKDAASDITGDSFKRVIQYLEAYFEEAVERHRKAWRYDRKRYLEENFCGNGESEVIFVGLELLEDYHIDSVTREWNSLKESWERRKYLETDDVIKVHNIIANLHKQIQEKISKIEKEENDALKNQYKCNTLYMNKNFCDSDTEQFEKRKGKLMKRSCWDTEVERVRKHIAIRHERFGKIFVPKICKIKLPCGQDGCFGDLELGINWKGEPIAVKYLKPNCAVSELAAAVSSVRKVRHEFLLPCYMSPGPVCILATPLMDFNLGQLVMHLSAIGLLQREAFRIVLQLMTGLKVLHSWRIPIIHGNLKPTNIFVNSEGTVKVAEFGLNLEQSEGSSSLSSLIWKACEQINAHLSGERATGSLTGDVASAGMLIHFVLSGGKHPFGIQVNEILANVLGGAFELSVNIPTLRDLLVKMLDSNPGRRPTMDRISKHIYWWTKKKQWQLVSVCSEANSEELHSFFAQHVANFRTHSDKAILLSKGGVEELQVDVNQWLQLLEKAELEPLPPVSRLKRMLPNLPFYIYTILEGSSWESSELLQQFFGSLPQTCLPIHLR